MNIFDELILSFSPDQDGFFFMWILALVALSAVVLISERWFDIHKRTNVDAEKFTNTIKKMLIDNNGKEAFSLCTSAGKRVLPLIFGAGIKKIEEPAEIIIAAMEEESLHLIPILERRLNYILMFGNISTLIGLMGTIFGLILSFAAVAQPDVDPIAKSSLLAAGISTAMNTTLFGLIISVPCILLFSILRAKIDSAIQHVDQYSTSLLKSIVPQIGIKKNYRISGKRMKEEVDTEPNIAPMMNLMVILIPLLLSSAEFVKIGAIELKLPESSQNGSGGNNREINVAKLNLGIVIKKDGFNLFHYFKKSDSTSLSEGEDSTAHTKDDGIEIPLKDGKFDFETLHKSLSEIKKKTLFEIIKLTNTGLKNEQSLIKLYTYYKKNDFSTVEAFSDHDDIKIVAEDTIAYEHIIAVMDAARGTTTAFGKVSMFPNVSLAGGMIQ